MPVVLICSLVIGLLVSGAFAYSEGSPDRTPEELIASANPNLGLNSNVLNDWIANGYSSGNYYYLFTQVPSGIGNYVFCISCSCEFGYYDYRFYAKEPNAIWNYCYVQPNGSSNNVANYSSPWDSSQFGSETYYLISNNNYFNIAFMMQGACWSNFNFKALDSLGGVTISNGNLISSAYEPDSRSLFCELSYLDSDTYGELPYIYVSTSDIFDYNNSYCYFEFTDARGPGQTTTIVSSQYINPHIVDTDYSSWIFSPYLISAYDFTITALTYYSDSFGSKTINLNIPVTFGEGYPLETGWNQVVYFTEYISNHSNGAFSCGFTHFARTFDNSFWIDYDDKQCWQNFDVKVLFVPSFLSSNVNNLDIEWLFQLYELYDVIFTGVDENTYDILTSSGTFDGLETIYNNDGFEVAMRASLNVDYNFGNLTSDESFSERTWVVNQSIYGFIVSRSFLLKRVLSSLGDIDSRLLEFETNLVGEDGLGASIQNKLNNLYSQQNDFFSDISRFCLKLEYMFNGVSFNNIEKFLHDIWEATVGEFEFDFSKLEHPWIDIYNLCKGLFDDGQTFLSDLTDSTQAMLGGSSMTQLPIPSITVQPVLPFNPSVTPIPIPTIVYPSFTPIPIGSGG